MAYKCFDNKTYNERLFDGGGIRAFFHNSRFKWLTNSCKKLNLQKGSVLELGFFDGRSLKFLPFQPDHYAGYDADWEGGMEDALVDWKDYPQYRFFKSDQLATFNPDNKEYDYSISMETLEHLTTDELQDYLDIIGKSTISYGFYSVPVERGLFFLFKYWLQHLLKLQTEKYTAKEVFYATIGRLDKVERNERGHKGFDYDMLIQQLKKHFDIVDVKGLPFPFLPLFLNFTVGIIAKKSKTL
jgi:hypothetical protein